VTLPGLHTAERYLQDAEALNPGGWVAHSRYVALAAWAIAEQHPNLDPERVCILGLLHDIGRRTGPNQGRHIIDGYDHLMTLGAADAARIALTHSFPQQRPGELVGARNGTPEQHERMSSLLLALTYTEEDRLLQLCDRLALSHGFCLLEQRIVDATPRYGVTPNMTDKWRAVLDLKAHFDQVVGQNIYRLLPGLVENILA
jgi:HD domain